MDSKWPEDRPLASMLQAVPCHSSCSHQKAENEAKPFRAVPAELVDGIAAPKDQDEAPEILRKMVGFRRADQGLRCPPALRHPEHGIDQGPKTPDARPPESRQACCERVCTLRRQGCRCKIRVMVR